MAAASREAFRAEVDPALAARRSRDSPQSLRPDLAGRPVPVARSSRSRTTAASASGSSKSSQPRSRFGAGAERHGDEEAGRGRDQGRPRARAREAGRRVSIRLPLRRAEPADRRSAEALGSLPVRPRVLVVAPQHQAEHRGHHHRVLGRRAPRPRPGRRSGQRRVAHSGCDVVLSEDLSDVRTTRGCGCRTRSGPDCSADVQPSTSDRQRRVPRTAGPRRGSTR